MALSAQGLLQRQPFGRGTPGTLKTIRRLGYVQIDTISVVARAHHHAFWSRVPNYRAGILERLENKREVFEYWSHAAAYLPMEDYRFCLPMMRRIKSRGKHWFPRNPHLMAHVLDRIRAEGPLKSRDFTEEHRSREMWDIKPTKMALHELFIQGDIMVAGRAGFQKIYDLPERILPADMDTTTPGSDESAAHQIRSGLRAHGLIAESEITYQRRENASDIQRCLASMLEAGEVMTVEVAGQTYYTTGELLESLPPKLGRRRAALISPFDNAVIQRKRLQRLFGFDYQMEIYYPVAKRIYGYFSMPILWGDRFVGRIDPKADRKRKVLIIKNAMLEPPFDGRDEVWAALVEAIREFAAFNGCDHVETRPNASLNDWLR